MVTKILSAIILIFLLSCSDNFLQDLSNKNSDDALIFDARTALNAQKYQDAIDIITLKVSGSGQARVDAREALASAYAGRCGLNFLDYVNRLAASNTGSAFVLAATPFVGVTVDTASCLLALQTLDLIGTNATRTTDQNAFASIVGMVLMGSATRLYTDNNPVNGDGSQDAVDISCALTNAQVDDIILGYGYMAQNFSALSSGQIGNSSSTTISDSINTCTAVAGTACQITHPADITNPLRDTMRDLLNTVQYGVGLADGSNPVLIPAACP